MPMFGLPASPCPDMAGAQGRGRVSGRGYFVRDRRATIVEIQMVIRTIVDRSSQYSAYIQRTVAALAMAWRRALNCERSEHSFYVSPEPWRKSTGWRRRTDSRGPGDDYPRRKHHSTKKRVRTLKREGLELRSQNRGLKAGWPGTTGIFEAEACLRVRGAGELVKLESPLK